MREVEGTKRANLFLVGRGGCGRRTGSNFQVQHVIAKVILPCWHFSSSWCIEYDFLGRFTTHKMQSAYLDGFGGEKVVDPSTQEILITYLAVLCNLRVPEPLDEGRAPRAAGRLPGRGLPVVDMSGPLVL